MRQAKTGTGFSVWQEDNRSGRLIHPLVSTAAKCWSSSPGFRVVVFLIPVEHQQPHARTLRSWLLVPATQITFAALRLQLWKFLHLRQWQGWQGPAEEGAPKKSCACRFRMLFITPLTDRAPAWPSLVQYNRCNAAAAGSEISSEREAM